MLFRNNLGNPFFNLVEETTDDWDYNRAVVLAERKTL